MIHGRGYEREALYDAFQNVQVVLNSEECSGIAIADLSQKAGFNIISLSVEYDQSSLPGNISWSQALSVIDQHELGYADIFSAVLTWHS